jgi:hypothetical protein
MDSTISPRVLLAEADGNRTRLGARAPTTVLKTAGPTRNPDASAREHTRGGSAGPRRHRPPLALRVGARGSGSR